MILDGKYQNLELDPGTYQIGGFIPGGDEIGPGSRSFNLGESELTISANIDPYFSGVFIAAVTPENEVEIEEAYFQNTGFIPGTTFKVGRFLSGFGYLNEIHAHAWDFVDAPLVHQAFFGGQLKEEGLQARWLAPTPVFLEFGLETGRGANFPGSDRNKNGVQLRRGVLPFRRRCRRQQQLSHRRVLSQDHRMRRIGRMTTSIPLATPSPTHSPATARCGVWTSSGSGRQTAIRPRETSSSRRSTCIATRTAA